MSEISYGLLETGFRRKRLPELLQGLNDRVADKLGMEIQTSANSVFGQIHGVYAFALAEIWEELEKLYFSMFPSTAEGVSLSNSAGLAGIAQVAADKTTIIATCYGKEGTEIPFGAQISSGTNTSMIFTNREVSEKISATRANEIHLKISNVEVGKVYSINLDGTQASYTAASGNTATTIFTSLKNNFDFDDRTFSISNDVLKIEMNDAAETFSLSTSTVTIEKLGSPFLFECVNYGAINPSVGSVNQIVTNYSGWDSVSNNKIANVGRDSETDTELRQRWSLSVYGRGSAMCESIAAAIYQQCAGVTVVKVYENTSDEEDSEGRPPHSIETVVSGGEPQEICDVILAKKAAGIDTFGSVTRTSIDSQEISHEIKFNRPAETKIWLKIVVDESDKEDGEIFGGLQGIKAAVLEVGNSFNVGQDVILQKFYSAVYENCTGAGYVEITASTNGTNFSAKNIKIDARHFASFDDSRIEVSEK